MKKLVGLFVCVGALVASVASATPIYVAGNVCPPGPAPSGPNRQYTASGALACAYDPSQNNIQGTTGEANTYLNNAGGVTAFGTGLTSWIGLGQNPTGFSFTSLGGGTSGTFTIGSSLTATYNQFVLGIKDGGNPMFALFLLPTQQYTGTWAFLSSGGSLSHFALYARTNTAIGPPPPPPPPAPVPEPGSMMLLGTGLLGMVGAARKRFSRQA